MRFYPADPDIATVFNRIQDGDIDLQPDFQRGEVWQVPKQQRLVDSILRGWIVPPILVVVSPGSTLQVLDGQQRLASIRDFKLGLFRIDGRIAPPSNSILALNGLTYAELPTDVQKRFDRTTIRIFEVSDFTPEEPAEIFFRLNQPTPLTAAEKRNAFFGPVRNQIKILVSKFEHQLEAAEILGFNNSRMAYDEVIGRFVCTLEVGSLNKKITASVVDDLYRREFPVSNTVLNRLGKALDLLTQISQKSLILRNQTPSFKPKLTRATVHSWLLFLTRFESYDAQLSIDALTNFFVYFEQFRQAHINNDSLPDSGSLLEKQSNSIIYAQLFVFNDRASSRVNDVSSVVLRDLILWMAWANLTHEKYGYCTDPSFPNLIEQLSFGPQAIFEPNELYLIDLSEHLSWGRVF
jgi:Protein of unknown function DUF262